MFPKERARRVGFRVERIGHALILKYSTKLQTYGSLADDLLIWQDHFLSVRQLRVYRWQHVFLRIHKGHQCELRASERVSERARDRPTNRSTESFSCTYEQVVRGETGHSPGTLRRHLYGYYDSSTTDRCFTVLSSRRV